MWEWVDDWLTEGDRRAFRGGAWSQPALDADTTQRHGFRFDDATNALGFRCAHDANLQVVVQGEDRILRSAAPRSWRSASHEISSRHLCYRVGQGRMLIMAGSGSGGGAVVTLVARFLSTRISLFQDPERDALPCSLSYARLSFVSVLLEGMRVQKALAGRATGVMRDASVA